MRLEAVELRLGERRVLGPVALDLPPGAHALLLGANGAGKTQLLKLLGGERWPTPTGRERRVYRDARGHAAELAEVLPRIAHLSGERQDKYVRYDWNFTVERVVGTGCHAADRPLARLSDTERARVRGALVRLGLWTLRRRRFLTLSYGERRRVLLARVLAARPRLLLLDEPFNGLDTLSRARLEREIERLARTRLTIVLTAHRLADAPRGFGRAIVLDRGRIVHDGRLGARARRWLDEAPSAGREPPPAAARRRAPRGNLLVLREADVYRDYRPVIRGLNWTIAPGEHWGVVGANGSGKSTLLKLIYGDLHVALGGFIARRGHASGSHIELWRRRVGFVSPELQAEYLAGVSVEELIVSGLHASVGLERPPNRRERARAGEALRRVGLAVAASRPARELSYGQMRLALFARALVTRPEALLLDEPLTGLDTALRRAVRALLSRLAAEGVQLVMATHHPADLVPDIGHVLSIAGGSARVGTRRVRRR